MPASSIRGSNPHERLPWMSEIEITIDACVRDRLPQYSTPEHDISPQQIEAAVRHAAALGGCEHCQIGVRVTDDNTIHEINQRFLQHDYPTDVISFPYDLNPPTVEGEIVVSIDTAANEANAAGWSVGQELLLYIIHGTLHLVGYDDKQDTDRLRMRDAEQQAMRNAGWISS